MAIRRPNRGKQQPAQSSQNVELVNGQPTRVLRPIDMAEVTLRSGHDFAPSQTDRTGARASVEIKHLARQASRLTGVDYQEVLRIVETFLLCARVQFVNTGGLKLGIMNCQTSYHEQIGDNGERKVYARSTASVDRGLKRTRAYKDLHPDTIIDVTNVDAYRRYCSKFSIENRISEEDIKKYRDVKRGRPKKKV